MPALRRLTLLLMAAITLVPVPQSLAQLFEDAPQIIPSDQALSEQQRDHVEAVTLFAQGRVLLQRGLAEEDPALFTLALRRFQRACRFDPELVSYLEVAARTEELDRTWEKSRYLILAAERQEIPVELLERIVAELADFEQMDAQQAQRVLQLYRQLRQRQGEHANVLTQFQLGRLALTTGQFDEAAQALTAVQQALEAEPGPGVSRLVRQQLLQRADATYTLLGESYLRAGRLDEAEQAFRRAHEAKPDPATLAYRLALVQRERGDLDAARQSLEQYLAAKSTAAGIAPYALLEALLDPQPKTEESETEESETEQPAERHPSDQLLSLLQQRAAEDPDNTLLGYYTADALQRARRWDEAAAWYKKLLEKDPAVDGHRGLIEIYQQQQQVGPLLEQLGALVAQLGSLDPLDEDLERLTEPATLDPLARHAQSLAAQADTPLPPGAWWALALLHAESKQDQQAWDCVQQGLQHPIPAAGQAAVNVAFALFQAEQPQRAAQVFEQILQHKLLPDRRAEVHYYLAGAYTLAKDYDRALASARRAGELDASSARLQAREAWVLFQARRLDEARRKYLELLDKFDGDHNSRENRDTMREIRLALSAVEVELDHYEAAEEWLQQVLDEFPEDVGACNDLGYLWTDHGQHLHRALTMIEKAVAAEPDNVAYLDSLGWALYRLGRYQEAVAPLEKAVAQGADGVILDHLGDVYLQVNQPDQAVATWRRAAETLVEGSDATRAATIQAKIQQHAPQ